MSANLHLVASRPPAPVCTVPDHVAITRHVDGRYLVQNVRHNGGTVASVFYSRAQLQQLVEAAQHALTSA